MSSVRRVAEQELVEREDELDAIDSVLTSARTGAGQVLLIEGPAGIGKTSLIREARERARDAGMTVLTGVGTEFEREYPFGLVRQALGPTVRRKPDRERLLTGAAALAEPALLDLEAPVEAAPFGLLNGLFWLLATLADENEVLLCADDVQWADEPSLRFLGFLARRLDAIAVAVIAGARTEADFGGAPAGLNDLRTHVSAYGSRLEPRALDAAGVTRLLERTVGRSVDAAFAAGCLRATGGNPFLLRELAEALNERDSGMSADDADRVHELSAPGVTRSVRSNLKKLGDDATSLAEAVAVLGEGTHLDLAAEQAEREAGEATAAVQRLIRAGLIEDEDGLRFRHPILAAAVRESMPSDVRASEHARAAAVLRARGEPVDRVALQLLNVPPAGDEGVVAELRQAAAHARERAAPTSAATMLRRALAEPPPDELRPQILIELGRVELDVGDLVAASDHFEKAWSTSADPLVRGEAAMFIGTAMPGSLDDQRRVAQIVGESYAEVAPVDRELALRLRSTLVLAGQDPEADKPAGDTLAEAMTLGTMVFDSMTPEASADDIAELARRGARQADGLLEQGAIALAFTGIVLGLRWSDRLDEALQLLDRAIETSRRRGAAADFGMAMTLRANVHRRAGRLREAEADARAALPLSFDDRWAFARGIQPLAGSLLEQGRAEDAARELTAVVGETEPVVDSPPMLPVLLMRMTVHAALRRHELALADWTEACARADRRGGINAGWIEDVCVAADVHLALGDVESARSTARQAVELAERWGTPGARGQALHAVARVGQESERQAVLEAAVELLGQSPARLQYAHALVALGAEMRRKGARRASREPLREGHELAGACGADDLAEHARAELRASGVRIKSRARQGADALTPSERRIADLAAGGLSNAEIAQELFLTVKTVEMHLTQVYRKLEISGRRDLTKALPPV